MPLQRKMTEKCSLGFKQSKLEGSQCFKNTAEERVLNRLPRHQGHLQFRNPVRAVLQLRHWWIQWKSSLGTTSHRCTWCHGKREWQTFVTSFTGGCGYVTRIHRLSADWEPGTQAAGSSRKRDGPAPFFLFPFLLGNAGNSQSKLDAWGCYHS